MLFSDLPKNHKNSFGGVLLQTLYHQNTIHIDDFIPITGKLLPAYNGAKVGAFPRLTARLIPCEKKATLLLLNKPIYSRVEKFRKNYLALGTLRQTGHKTNSIVVICE